MSKPKRPQREDYPEDFHGTTAYLYATQDYADELEAEVKRQKGFVGEWEEDSACLPEDQSITDTVTALRNRITELERRVQWYRDKEDIATDRITELKRLKDRTEIEGLYRQRIHQLEGALREGLQIVSNNTDATVTYMRITGWADKYAALAGEQTTPPHDPRYDTVPDVRKPYPGEQIT